MQKPWFKAKQAGWGWYPHSWQGWSISFLYVLLLAWSLGRFSNYVIGHTAEPFLSILFPVLLHALWVAFLVWTLLSICSKTSDMRA